MFSYFGSYIGLFQIKQCFYTHINFFSKFHFFYYKFMIAYFETFIYLSIY